MAKIRYRYHIRRTGGKKGRVFAFFEDPAAWEALQMAAPGARALLTEAGFRDAPPLGADDPDFVPVGRDEYQALQRRLRDGLEMYDPTPAPGDAFQIEDFLAWVPHCGPDEAREALLGVPNTGREVGKEHPLKWVAILCVTAGGLSAAAFFLVFQPTTANDGGPSLAGVNPLAAAMMPPEMREQVAASLALAESMGQPTTLGSALEKAGYEDIPIEEPAVEQAAMAILMQEAMRRAQALKSGRDQDEAMSASRDRMRESLDALRSR